MKKVFIMVFLLIALGFLYYGNAQAVLGVADDVPGTDIVFPIICEKSGTLNTVWAILNVKSSGANAYIRINDSESNNLYNSWPAPYYSFTGYDIVPDDACALINSTLTPSQKASIEKSISGRVYYVAYLILDRSSITYPDNRFVSWVYFVDLVRGFASGFKGFQAEDYLNWARLSEWSSSVSYPVTASTLYARFLIYNSDIDSFNWWIFLTGDDGPSYLKVYYTDEDENYVWTYFYIDELAVIDVEDNMPGGLFTGYPKNGYAEIFVYEADTLVDDTWLGWAYQRYKAATIEGSWDAIHPMDRKY